MAATTLRTARRSPDWYADLTLAAVGYTVALGLAVVHVVDLDRDRAEELLRVRDQQRFAGHRSMRGLNHVVQAFGMVWFLLFIAAAAIVVLMALRQPRRVRAVSAVTLTAIAAVAVSKLLIRHPAVATEFGRRVGSFPSGHTTDVTAVVGVVLVSLAPIRFRLVPYAVAIGLGIVVGSSRVFSGAHTPDDVVAGWFLGSALVLTAGAWLAARDGS